jgi:hypothetical protein
MNLDTVRHFMNAEPFQAIEIRLANGDTHKIQNPENIAVGKNVIVIAYSESDRIAWCTPHQIVSIEKAKSGRARRNGHNK